MGKRGQRPTPTVELERRGNPNVARLRRDEPKPRPGIPAKPDHLSETAAVVWDWYTVMLDNTGVLTLADGLAMEQLCEVYAEWFDADNAVRELGEYFTTPSGVIHAHPAVRQRAEARKDLFRLLKEHGLTPASRPDLHALASGEEIEADRIT